MDNLVKLNSVTQAMRARDILRSNGIKANIQRIPAGKGEHSCSYGLSINNNNISRAVEILRKNNIKVSGRAI
ncbi:MAG: DUF3343 domain-containing protein [Ruminococcus sp.]|nr:DUF3343 domain-containing protein [Ruminococcus sp.]